MALAVRELELVLIARDRASATLARVGGAMAILGGAAARLGAEGIGFFAEVTNEAIEFRRTIAEVFTQVEVAGATYEDVLNMVRNSARTSAVPLEDLRDVAYDLFSTLTLDNMEQAAGLLDTIAVSATAGQAPAKDIGRAVIAWTNALNIQSPTVEDFNRILDVQFELVRKGAGNYTEFAGVIGKAIPPFVAANQGVEELGGSLAFLTKNGLSAAEASTSASRAIELLYGPKAIKGLRNIGIEIEDANGNFRAMDDLLADVVEHFRGLSDAERKLTFQDIFGQGRIQARRFFDLILAEGNFEEFLFLLDAMRGSAGEVATAFDIMMAEPAVQLDVMRNRFKVLRQEIGDVFIPFLTSKLLPALDRLLDWWEDLDEIQRNNLVQWAAFATLFLTIGGALTAVVGTAILFIGILQAFVGSFGLALALGTGVVGVISALAAAIALAILDWELFIEIFGPWWEKALTLMQPVIDWIQTNWPAAWVAAEEAYEGVRTFFEQDWPIIWENVKTAVIEAWKAIVGWWDSNLRQPIEDFVSFVFMKAEEIATGLGTIFDDFWTQVKPIWDAIAQEFGPTIVQLVETMLAVGKAIAAISAVVVGAIVVWWNLFGDLIVNQVAAFVEIIGGVIRGLLQVIEGGVTALTGLLSGDLGLAWEGLKTAGQGAAGIIGTAWEGIFTTIGNVVGNIANAPTNLENAVADLETMFGDLEGNIVTSWDNMETSTLTTVSTMSGSILDMYNAFTTIPTGAALAQSELSGPLAGMESGVISLRNLTSTSLSIIERRWRETAERIRAQIWATRNTFPVFSPGSRFSPPMTQQIEDSLALINKSYGYNLGQIESRIRSFGKYMRTELSEYTPWDPRLAFANSSVGVQPQGPSTMIGQNIDRQVTVEKVITQANARDIASEIAWQAMNS